jgi:uncharacterized protein YodC (DUF2158 family)
MSDKKWKSGDLVRLKSGGPTMTVDRYTNAYDMNGSRDPLVLVVKCMWFQDIHGVNGGLFASGPCQAEISEDALVGFDPGVKS